jgi:hypothetical protein
MSGAPIRLQYIGGGRGGEGRRETCSLGLAWNCKPSGWQRHLEEEFVQAAGQAAAWHATWQVQAFAAAQPQQLSTTSTAPCVAECDDMVDCSIDGRYLNGGGAWPRLCYWVTGPTRRQHPAAAAASHSAAHACFDDEDCHPLLPCIIGGNVCLPLVPMTAVSRPHRCTLFWVWAGGCCCTSARESACGAWVMSAHPAQPCCFKAGLAGA